MMKRKNMPQVFIHFFAITFFLFGSISCKKSSFWTDQYNVIWTSQSKNSSESMPCGGGDIGMNVWVENGDLLMYIDRSGNIDENDQQLKSGRIRISFKPNPLADSLNFTQELVLKDGSVSIKGKDFSAKIWVEVNDPVIHIETESKQPVTAKASYESWRTKKRLVPRTLDEKGKPSGWDNNRWAMFGYFWYNGDVYSYPDSISFRNNTSVQFFHQNNNNDLIFDKETKLMRINQSANKLVSPSKNRVFGGMLIGDGMVADGNTEGAYALTAFKAWNLVSVKPSLKHHICLYLATTQSEKKDAWQSKLDSLVDATKNTTEKAWKENEKWWAGFWDRSHVIMDQDKGPGDAAWQLARNYTLFRYQLALNVHGEFPTRFNGGLLTFDPNYVINTNPNPDIYNPDYRWWGAWTGQNQRLIYWPMLKNGDFDMVLPQLNFYSRNLPNALARSYDEWGIEGAAYGEQIGSGGLPLGSHYGWEPPYGDRKPNQEIGVANFHPYYYTSQLEMGFIAEELNRFSNADITKYLPFIKESIILHFEYYKMLQERRTGKPYDENGKLVIDPSHALETYRGKNSTDVICALKVTMERLLNYPDKWVSSIEKAKFKEWLSHLPPINFRERDGHKTIAPLADDVTKTGNYEIPQLYPVFPWGLYGIGRPDLQVAIDTWKYGVDGMRGKEAWENITDPNVPIWYPSKKFWYGWTQQAIWLARLGLTDEAKEYIVKKLSDARVGNDFESASRMRFPSFWGPGFDWTPDHNWGGSGMIALQKMLMQTTNNKIYLLPAWPKDWDVDFKLHAPQNTIVECVFKNGKIELLKVTPESRRKDIISNDLLQGRK